MAADSSKEMGQVFTPGWVVGLILNEVGFRGKAAASLRVLEPSCGNGAFLVEMADRLVASCEAAGLAEKEVVRRLQTNLVGIDLDSTLLEEARARLDELARTWGLGRVKWDLRHLDTLAWAKATDERFDRVVGNPPYVRIHNLPEATRELLREQYETCRKGMTDTYVAFYEAGLGVLAGKGKLGYIAPNSFLYNAAARPFRALLLERGLPERVVDFGDGRVFEDASTYTAIVVLSGDGGRKDFLYSDGDARRRSAGKRAAVRVPLGDLDDGPWVLPPDAEPDGDRVGDLIKVQYGVATLADAIFISEDVAKGDSPETVLFNGTPVEKSLLKPAIKVSTYYPGATRRWALWPYRTAGDGTVEVIPEEDMRREFPLGLAYFEAHRKRLLERDLHDPKAFYEYGRSQALAAVDQPKLVLPPVIRDAVHAYIVPKGTVPYGGFFATGPRVRMKRVLEAVEDPRFLGRAMRAGKPMRDGWRAINAAVLREYRIPR